MITVHLLEHVTLRAARIKNSYPYLLACKESDHNLSSLEGFCITPVYETSYASSMCLLCKKTKCYKAALLRYYLVFESNADKMCSYWYNA